MAKYEASLTGSMDGFLSYFESSLFGANASASLEESSNYAQGEFSCALRVYERYSGWSNGRVSLTLLLVGTRARFSVTAITAGGSQALFFKVNTLGEESFLSKARQIIDSWQG